MGYFLNGLRFVFSPSVTKPVNEEVWELPERKRHEVYVQKTDTEEEEGEEKEEETWKRKKKKKTPG